VVCDTKNWLNRSRTMASKLLAEDLEKNLKTQTRGCPSKRKKELHGGGGKKGREGVKEKRRNDNPLPQ